MYTGPHIIKDGLVFGYDTGYGIADNNTTTRFYPGQPATNLVSAYNDNHVRSVSWTNSGTWVATYNASNRDKPVILGVDMSKCNLMHGETVTTGSQHFGCASVSVSASTTYTMSVYYLQNRAGASRPYFRTSVNNNNLGYLNYNGSTNTSNWPVNEWIRISVTVTVQSNENACYLSNYLGSQVGDQVWYCAPMVEQTSQLTTFVDGTRSSTASLIDLKETASIDVSNVSFDSTGQPTFDGSDDYIELSDALNSIGSVATFEMVFKATETSDNYRIMLGWGHGNNNYSGIHIGSWTSGYTDEAFHVTFNASTLTMIVRKGHTFYKDNKYHHAVVTAGVNNYSIWIDGIEQTFVFAQGSQSTVFSNIVGYNSNIVSHIGKRPYGGGSGFFKGEIPVMKVYDTVLSDEEIKQNFNAYKNRFDI